MYSVKSFIVEYYQTLLVEYSSCRKTCSGPFRRFWCCYLAVVDNADAAPAVSTLFSEATQCITLYSRQGTTETIEEVEDEQDQVESEDKAQALRESQELEENQGAECSLWSDGEPRQEVEEEETKEEVQKSSEEQKDGDETADQERRDTDEVPWESFDPDEGSSLPLEEAESALSGQDGEFITDSEDGERRHDFLPSQAKGGLQLCTPDTDASKTSDADVPPSYSKAVSFDRLEVSDDESDMDRKRRMVMTSDSRSDSRSDIMLPSMTTELTASELLLNK